MTGFPAAVRATLAARAAGYCEACGIDAPEQAHHRRCRGMGSTRRPETNRAANGLLVSQACHQMIESNRELAYRRGWLVRQSHDPAAVPVLRYGSEWVLLGDDGSATPTTPPEGEHA